MHSGFNLRIEQFFLKADLFFYMHIWSALSFLIANVRDFGWLLLKICPSLPLGTEVDCCYRVWVRRCGFKAGGLSISRWTLVIFHICEMEMTHFTPGLEETARSYPWEPAHALCDGLWLLQAPGGQACGSANPGALAKEDGQASTGSLGGALAAGCPDCWHLGCLVKEALVSSKASLLGL